MLLEQYSDQVKEDAYNAILIIQLAKEYQQVKRKEYQKPLTIQFF